MLHNNHLFPLHIQTIYGSSWLNTDLWSPGASLIPIETHKLLRKDRKEDL